MARPSQVQTAPALLLLVVSLFAGGKSGSSENKHSDAAAQIRHRPSVGQPGQSTRVQDAERLTQAALSLRKKLTEKDLARSSQMLQESANLYHKAGQPSRAGNIYLEFAKNLVMASRYEDALHAYTAAIEIAGADLNVRCTALSGMARTYANIDRSAEAKRSSQQAVTMCQESSDSRVRADAMESRGEVLFWTDDLKTAAEFLTRARDLFRESHDDDGQAAAILMLAYASDEGDSTLPFGYAEEASRLWSSAGNQYGTARAHLAQAYFASKAGSLGLAQCHGDQAFRVFHRVGDKDNEGIALNLLGRISRETGDTETALIDYGNARADFVRAQDRPGEIEAISGVASALTALHRDRLLLPLYARKFQLAQQGHIQSLMASALSDKAGVYQRRQQSRRAEQLFRRAIAMYRAADNTSGEGKALILLAKLKVEAGDLDQAVTLLEDALKLKEKTGEIADVARIQYELADIYSRQNHPALAKDAIEKTIAIIESERLKISNFDSRATYFESVHRYYSLYVQVLMTLDRENPGLGFSQTAFEASEKSKVRSLIDLLSTSDEDLSCDAILSRQEELKTSLSLVSGAWSDASAGSSLALSLPQVQKLIGDDDALLEYSLGGEASHLWLVDRHNIVGYELPPSRRLKELVAKFRASLMPPQSLTDESSAEYVRRKKAAAQAYKVNARQLSQALLGPLVLSKGKRLLIVTDGALQYIPFVDLPLPRPEGSDATLLSQHEIVILPSASALRALRVAASKRTPPTSAVAIFADPVFERTTPRTGATERSSSPISRTTPLFLARALHDMQRLEAIPRLPGSRKEAMAIREIFGPHEVFTALGFDATRSLALSGRLEPYRILHFATHGIIDTRHPELSGLILSLVDRRGQQQDGYLRLADIYTLKLSADLVVLSSCDSALGKQLESEGMIGLPRGFLQAGARSVIASLWKVDDDATATLMRALYLRMQRGESPSAALRGAQLEMAKGKRYAQPFYWAAFVLEGDYK